MASAPNILTRHSAPTARPLRVALLGYRSNPYSGGQGIYIKYVARALTDLGHQVDVISGEPYPDLDSDIRLVKLPGLNLFAHPDPWHALSRENLTSFTDLFEWASMVSGGFPEPYTFGRRVVQYMKQHGGNYDVVHDNQCLSHGTYQLQKMGLPLLTTIHHPITFDLDIALAHTKTAGMRMLIRRWHLFLKMQAKVARRLRHIVTVSESSKRDICQAFNVEPETVKVIYNGVDAGVFRPRPEITKRPLQLITTASADQPLKGTQHLIPALASLRQRFPDLRLTFIGQPKPNGETARLIAQHNLGPLIDFQHGIANQDIVDLYAGASVAVIPSEYEGFGLPAAEAMACAVPVVSTDGGALPEVVGDAGIIVPKSNPQALAEGISRLLDNPELQQSLGQAGRARMLQHFTWTGAGDALTHYYNEAIAL